MHKSKAQIQETCSSLISNYLKQIFFFLYFLSVLTLKKWITKNKKGFSKTD